MCGRLSGLLYRFPKRWRDLLGLLCGLAFGRVKLAAGRESHERGVEVDVGGVALGAGGVAGELVLVARPGVVGDLVFDAGAQEDGELGGGSFDAGRPGRSRPNPPVRRRSKSGG